MKKFIFLCVLFLSLGASAQTLVASVTFEVRELLLGEIVYTESYGEMMISVVPDCENRYILEIETITAFNEQKRIPYGLPPVTYSVIEFCPPVPPEE